MQHVDGVIETLDKALKATNQTCNALEKVKAGFKKESEILPRDKYTVFSRTGKNYRKGIHKVPKWTRMDMRQPLHRL